MNIVSTGQLKAQSISFQVSNRTHCNARCKFCISRLTPNVENTNLRELQLCDLRDDVPKGLNLAARMGATHAILTGKAEPTQEDPDYVHGLIKVCSDHGFLVDMHTNGFLLHNNRNDFTLEELRDSGLTMITFSIAHHDIGINKELMGVSVNYPYLILEAAKLGLLVRCSLVLCQSGIATPEDAAAYIHCMGELGAHMVVMRKLWTPSTYSEKNKEVFEWNQKNVVPLHLVSNKFRDVAVYGPSWEDWKKHPFYELAPLPWGASVYGMEGCFTDPEHGVNVTFAECDTNDSGPVLKSIVQKPNGHGYRNWDFNANILY